MSPPALLVGAAALLLACESRPAARPPPEPPPPPLAAAPAPDARPTAPGLRVEDVTRPRTPYEQAEASVDASALSGAFRRAGYTPPPGALLLVAEVVRGAGQPAIRYRALGDTGFAHSLGRFELASTLKLAVITGALCTLARHGLDGDTLLRFRDARGEHLGPARALYLAALSSEGSNDAAGRLQRIAGAGEMATEYFTAARGFPHLAILQSFDRDGMLVSAPVNWLHRGREGQIPERIAWPAHPRCPEGRACGTVYEAQDVLRRLVLHAELPEADRFPIPELDRRRVLEALARTTPRFGDAPARALGPGVRVLSKTGYLEDAQLLEDAYVEQPRTGRRLLLIAGVPVGAGPTALATSEAQLGELVRQALLAVVATPPTAPPVQRDHGPAPVLGRRTVAGAGQLLLDVALPGGGTPEVWANGRPVVVAPAPGGRHEVRFPRPGDGRVTLVIRGVRPGAVLSHARREVSLVPP